MTITSQTARSGPYNGNGSTTVFAYAFKALAAADLVVTLTVTATGVETVQTLTTHYSVSDVGESGGGNVTMVTFPASGETLTITRAVGLTQGVDLVNRGGVQPEVIETALDILTQIDQDSAEVRARSVTIPVSSSSSVSTELTAPAANTALMWNAAADGFAVGPTASAITGAAANATAAAASLTDFATRYLGAKGSAPTVDNDGNALITGALYFLTTTDQMFSYDGAAWDALKPTTAEQSSINAVEADATDIGVVAGDTTAIGVVAGDTAVINTVAGISANVTTVAADGTDIGVVAGDTIPINTVAGISANVTTVAGISANVTTVAADGTDIGVVAGDTVPINTVAGDTVPINAVAGIAANVTTVAGVAANVTTVAGIASAVTTVAADGTDIGVVSGISANVTTVAGISANVTTVAGISANTTTVAGISANVTTVAGISADVTTAATNVTDITNFAGVYVGGASSAPTTRVGGAALQTGDLYFNTATDILNVRNSAAAWQSASSAISSTFQRFEYTASGGETSFSGADDNSNSLLYDSGFAEAFLNGVLLNDADVTMSTGTSATGLAALTAGDKFEVIAHGTATAGDFYSKAAADAKYELIGAVTPTDLTAPGPIGGTTAAAINGTTGTFSGEVTGTGFTGTLDGILGGGTPAAASVTTLTGSSPINLADGTESLPAYVFTDNLNTGMWRPSSSRLAWSAGGTKIMEASNSFVMIHDTSNSSQVRGLTVNQLSSDNESFSLKSSDVAHQAAAAGFGPETDTYASIRKIANASGGLKMFGVTELAAAIWFEAIGDTNPTTTPGTTAQGLIHNRAWVYGGSHTGMSANTCVFSWSTGIAGGSARTRMILDYEGDLHLDATSNINSFDDHDDAMLIRAHEVDRNSANLIRSEFDDFVKYNKASLEAARIISVIDPDDPDSYDENGKLADPMVNTTQLQRLHSGAIVQQRAMFETLKNVLDEFNPGILKVINARLSAQSLPALGAV